MIISIEVIITIKFHPNLEIHIIRAFTSNVK